MLKHLPLRIELISLMLLMRVRLTWDRRSALIYLTYGIYLLGLLMFYFVARFRMPIVPLIMLSASGFVFEVQRRYQSGDRLVLMLPMGLIVAMVAILIRDSQMEFTFVFE